MLRKLTPELKNSLSVFWSETAFGFDESKVVGQIMAIDMDRLMAAYSRFYNPNDYLRLEVGMPLKINGGVFHHDGDWWQFRNSSEFHEGKLSEIGDTTKVFRIHGGRPTGKIAGINYFPAAPPLWGFDIKNLENFLKTY